MKKTNQKGFSLIEMMVVITIFAVIGIIVTSSVILTIAGAKKSESIIKARENLDYALNVIERNIRNANSIVGCSGDSSYAIKYLDQNNTSASFSCIGMGGVDSYIASGSSNLRLTSTTVKIVGCNFSCVTSTSSPPLVIIDLSVQNAGSSGIQSSNVSASTQIYLRNY